MMRKVCYAPHVPATIDVLRPEDLQTVQAALQRLEAGDAPQQLGAEAISLSFAHDAYLLRLSSSLRLVFEFPRDDEVNVIDLYRQLPGGVWPVTVDRVESQNEGIPST